MRKCYGCRTDAKLNPRGYCADCNNMQALKSIRASKSLPVLKQRAAGWSDARIAFEMEWLEQQFEALKAEGARRIGRKSAKAASA